MIYAIKVFCGECKNQRIIFLSENKLIRIPFICECCYNKKAIGNIISKYYDVLDRTIIVGFKKVLAPYKPLINKKA